MERERRKRIFLKNYFESQLSAIKLLGHQSENSWKHTRRITLTHPGITDKQTQDK